MIEDTPNTFTPAEMQCVMKTTSLVWDWIKHYLTEEELSKPPFHITKRLDQVLAKQVEKPLEGIIRFRYTKDYEQRH